MAKYILVHGIRVAKDFTPETFGRLTTLGPAFLVGTSCHQVCKCSCGVIKIVLRSNLKHKTRGTRSCGCLQTESRGKTSITHGEAGKTVEYRTLASIKRRCNNSNDKNYSSYGGRGIKVCQRWLGRDGYLNFLADMGRKPSPQHSIDRIDNNGDYCPENCRWANAVEQSNNRRNNKIVEYQGESLTVAQWADKFNVPYKIFHARLQSGWSFEDAAFTAVIDDSESIKAKALQAGLHYKCVWKRLKMGWTLEEALTIPSRKKRSQHG